MTTHSVTQTRQSLDTRTPTARPQIPADPTRGLEVLFGGTAQLTPAGETIPHHRTEENDPSSPHRTTTTREAQTSHPIPGKTSQNIQSPATQGAYNTPSHTIDGSLTQVGDDLLQQASIRDRHRQHLGFSYNPGDGWDHSHLDLVGNRFIQDQCMVHRSDGVTRFRPTQQSEEWSSRIATITHVHPTLWSSDEATLVRNALDTMLRGGPGRHNIGGDVRTWFCLQGQEN